MAPAPTGAVAVILNEAITSCGALGKYSASMRLTRPCEGICSVVLAISCPEESSKERKTVTESVAADSPLTPVSEGS